MTEIAPYATYKGQAVYDKKAACALLRVSERTLKRYISLGKIRARKIGLNRVAFFEKDLDGFLAL